MTRRWIGVLGVLAAGSLAGCASDWKSRSEQLARENLDLVAQNESLRNDSATAQASAESSREALRAMERESQKLLDERNAAIEAMRKAQAEAERRAAERASAGAAPAAKGGGLRGLEEVAGAGNVRERDNGDIAITLSNDISFASGESTLNEACKRILRGLASKLNGEFGASMIRVEGHTDNDPLVRTKAKYGDNLGLSNARASAVRRFLTEDLKVDAGRITTEGFGETRPIADNATKSGKAKNRRVELVVVTSAQAR